MGFFVKNVLHLRIGNVIGHRVGKLQTSGNRRVENRMKKHYCRFVSGGEMLKHLLESEGVPVVLHNVNLSQPVVSSGVRVRIHESDLPLALRIIENTDIFAPADNSIAGSRNLRENVSIDRWASLSRMFCISASAMS